MSLPVVYATLWYSEALLECLQTNFMKNGVDCFFCDPFIHFAKRPQPEVGQTPESGQADCTPDAEVAQHPRARRLRRFLSKN